MAANSKREQIILANKALIETLPSIKTVKRSMQSFSDLQNFALTQFPVAAIVGRLPIPKEKRTTRSGHAEVFLSSLSIDVFVYLMENDIEKMDEKISLLMDDFWAKLYTDQSRSDLVMTTELKMEENIETWPPFTAFKLIINHLYYHNTEGI